MPLSTPISVGDIVLQFPIANVTSGTTYHVPIPAPGRVKDMAVTVNAATTTGAATFTLAYAPPGTTTFTNITNAVVTLNSGTAAGGVGRVAIPSLTGGIQDGGTLRITVGGTATGGGTPNAYVTIGG